MHDSAGLLPDGGGGESHPLAADPRSSRWSTLSAMFVANVGGSIFVLPVVAHGGSLIITLALLAIVIAAAVYAAKLTVLGSAVNMTPAYSEAVVHVILGPDSRGKGARHPAGTVEMTRSATYGTAVGQPDTPGMVAALYTSEEMEYRRRLRLWLVYGIDALLYLGNILSSVGYVRMTVDTATPIMQQLHAGPVVSSEWFFFAIIFVVATAIGLMRSLGDMSAALVLGFATVFVPCIALCIVYFTTDGGEGCGATPEQRGDVHWLTFHFAGFAAMLPIALGSNAHHNIQPQIALEMRHFSIANYTSLATINGCVIFVLYSLVASFGYLTFGSAVVSAAAHGMVLNLYPRSVLWQAMRLSIAVHACCALLLFVVNTRVGLYLLYRRTVELLAHPRSTEAPCSSLAGSEEHAATTTDVATLWHVAGYDLSLRVRAAQSAALAFAIVGLAASTSSVTVITSWTGVVIGPSLVLLIPSIIAYRVFGGDWEGTAAAIDSGEPEQYAAWPLGRRLAVAVFVVGIVVQFIAVLSNLRVFGSPSS